MDAMRRAALIATFLVVAFRSAAAFEFIVQERGPAATTMQTEVAVAVTAEALGPVVQAVIVEADNPDQKVAVSLYISERFARRSVAAIGRAVRAATANYSETLVSFHLADQRGEPWATAHSTPKLDVKIHGLDREQFLIASQGVDANKLKTGDRIVAEAVMKDGAAQIIRNGKNYYWRQFDRDTDKFTDTEVKREKGRYWVNCCTGLRYLVTKTAIEVYDDQGLARSARRLK
ncbi:MAG: hypothetical protein RLZ98_288 [Pseudomonadota bacterium]|jgi:hypothetical protein